MNRKARIEAVMDAWDENDRSREWSGIDRAIEEKLSSLSKQEVVRNFPGGFFRTRQRVIERFVDMEIERGEAFFGEEWPQRMIEALETLPPPVPQAMRSK